jgi:hypothetical protein
VFNLKAAKTLGLTLPSGLLGLVPTGWNNHARRMLRCMSPLLADSVEEVG